METYVEDMILQVDKLFDAGEYAEGRRVLEEILEMEPDCGRAHNLLGWLHYYKLDNFRKAEYHYKLALKFSPKYPAVWTNYVNLLNYMGRFDEMKECAFKALEIPGINKSVIYNQLGQAHEVNGWLEDGMKYYQEAYMKAVNKNDYKLFLENFTRTKSKASFMHKLKVLFYKTQPTEKKA